MSTDRDKREAQRVGDVARECEAEVAALRAEVAELRAQLAAAYDELVRACLNPDPYCGCAGCCYDKESPSHE